MNTLLRKYSKFTSILLCMALVLTSLGFNETRLHAETVSWDVSAVATAPVTATLTDDGTLTISGTGGMKVFTSVTAPWASVASSIKALVIQDGVTSIPAGEFKGLQNLTTVSIGNSVAVIDGFAELPNLTTVSISNGAVKTINSLAFTKCPNLTTINIPNTVTLIGSNAFSYDTSLTNVIIPDSVTSIGDYAFTGDTNLGSITCLGVKTLGYNAFSNSGLTSITLGSALTNIGTRTFENCKNLVAVNFSGKLPSSLTFSYGVFLNCTSLSSISFPEVTTTSSIPTSTFEGCTNLHDIYLPSGYTITSGLHVPNAVYVHVNNASMTFTKEYSYLTRSNIRILAPISSTTATNALNVGFRVIDCAFGTEYTPLIRDNLEYEINDTVNKTVTVTGYYNKPIGTLVIPQTIDINGVTYTVNKIGDFAFGEIPNDANYLCPNLTEVVLPDSIIAIGSQAFCNAGLKSVNLPANIQTIGIAAFGGFKGDTFTFPEKYNVTCSEIIPSYDSYYFAINSANGYNNYIKHLYYLNKDQVWYNDPSFYTSYHYDQYKIVGFNSIEDVTLLSNIKVIASYIPLVPIYGGAGSVTEAWCKANSRLFYPITISSSPSADYQVREFNQANPTSLSYVVSMGSGIGSATSATVSISGTVLDSTQYTLSYGILSIKKTVFQSLPENIYAIEVEFNNITNTVISDKLIVNVIGESDIIPSVNAQTKTFDKTTPTNVTYSVSMGNGAEIATSVVPSINGTNIVSANYSYSNGILTIKSGALQSLANGTYSIDLAFNNSSNTTTKGALKVTVKETVVDVDPTAGVAPCINPQSVVYSGSEVSYAVNLGTGTLAASGVSKVTVNGVDLSSAFYSFTESNLTFNTTYLSNLVNGVYTIGVVFNDTSKTSILDKLGLIIPTKNTETPVESQILNILYLANSNDNLPVPLNTNADGISSVAIDGTVVSDFTFDSATSVLTIPSHNLSALSVGNHSLIIGLTYGIVVTQSVKTEFITMALGSSTTTMSTSNKSLGINLVSVSIGSTGLMYEVDPSTGKVTIIGYTGDSSNVTIPSTIDGKPVTGITPGAIPSGSTITGDKGSVAEDYANNNGNPFTPSTGSGGNSGNPSDGSTNPSAPSIPNQTVQYNKTSPSDVTIKNVNLGNASSISFITINGYKVYSNGVVEKINSGVQALSINQSISTPLVGISTFSTIDNVSAVSGSAISYSGTPFTLDSNGQLVIDKNLLSQLGLETASNYDVEVGFDNGNVVKNTVSMKVVEDSTTPSNPTNPTNPSNPSNGGTDSGNSSGGGSSSSGGSTDQGSGNTSGGSTSGNTSNSTPTPTPTTTTITDSFDKNSSTNIVITIPSGENVVVTITDSTGKAIDITKDNYTIVNGQVIIDKEFLSSLPTGSYIIKITIEIKNGASSSQEILNHVVEDKVSVVNSASQNIDKIPYMVFYKTVYKGSKFKINLENLNSSAKVTYTVKDSKIVSVSKNGVITPKKAGKTTITCVASNNGKDLYKYQIVVTVPQGKGKTNSYKNSNTHYYTELPVLHLHKTVYVKSNTKIVLKNTSDSVSVNYYSNSKNITVDKNGNIYGKKAGKATVTVIVNKNDKSYVYVIDVTCYKKK